MSTHLSAPHPEPQTAPTAAMQAEYRRLPAVEALLQRADVLLLAAELGVERAALAQTARTLLSEARAAIGGGAPAPAAAWWTAALAARLQGQARPALQRVINATGVILHTNLGRAPLSRAALAAAAQAAAGYTNLEYELEAGVRGSRHDHPRALLQRLTGAEDALVVNNNAAALWLMLAALCSGREVLISRGQLVEIGGGFRIPDVLRQSGATLVEVGTTNRTHAADFARAITPNTAAILRVHASNFRQLGFVAEPTLGELAALAHSPRPGHAPLLLLDDLGSGALTDTSRFGLAPEPMPAASLQDGADLVAFSGDKLVGGPQAGLIAGRAPLIAELRRHPLARALRVDKLTLAALDATLQAWASGRATSELPIWRMIAAQPEQLLARAAGWQATLQRAGWAAEIWAGESAVGGGSLPGETLPSWLLAVAPPTDATVAPSTDATAATVGGATAAAAALRRADPPVICRIQNERLLFDPRTVAEDEEPALLAALLRVLAGSNPQGSAEESAAHGG